MTYQHGPVKREALALAGGIICTMAKDTRLSVRVRSDLKRTLEGIAAEERRSVAQVCEAFLESGVHEYTKRGASYLQRFLKQRDSAPPKDE